MYNILQWATTEPEFNEQFVFITNIVDLPKQVENPKILLLVVAVFAFCIITIKQNYRNVTFLEPCRHSVAPGQDEAERLLRFCAGVQL